MKKQIFTLLTLLCTIVGGATSAWGATVSDLKTIATDYVFIADDITANGTTQLTANTLYDGNIIFAPTANSVATNKGNNTFEGGAHLNSLRVKNTQDQLCFKVSGACTVTFYTQSHSGRGIQVGSTAGGTQYGSQTASTTEWSCNITAAGVVYLSSYNGDFYFAGFKVTFPKTGQPTIGTSPTSAVYSQGDAAEPLSVSATAANSGALSYQWYKNETNKSVLTTEGAEKIEGATNATYTPSTTTASTTYYLCKVTEEGNANVATTRIATVKVNPAGFNVTFDLGSVTGTEGTLPTGASAITNFTIPINKTLYKDGYTLTAWNDGSADHAIGSSFNLSSDVTLTPVFTANGSSTYLGHNASTATWNFNNNTGAPTWNMNGSGTFVYVTQTSVGGNNMDLKMVLDATGSGAKIASNGDWTQVNTNSKLTVPAISGAVVKVYVYSDAAAPTFNGNDGSYDSTNKIYSYTATAEADIDIVYGDNDYASKVEVVYPSESAVLNVTANNTEVVLNKTSINSVDYLAVTTDNWATNKNYGGYTGDFYNMSSTDRKLTIKVTGASTFDVLVQNGSNGRTYLVKVGDGEAQQVTHGGTNVESSGVFAIDDPTGTTTITLSGGGTNANSVYPVAIKFNPAVSGTISESGWNTFSSNYKLDLSTITNGTVYVATATSGSNVTLTSTTAKVASGEGLMIKGTPGDEFTIAATADAATLTGDNLLVGLPTGGTVAKNNNNYVFGWATASDPGFYLVNATEPVLGAGKAYLHTNSALGARLAFNFDENPTAINNVQHSTFNVQQVFDLQGRKVAQPTKGLYIINGKKVIVK